MPARKVDGKVPSKVLLLLRARLSTASIYVAILSSLSQSFDGYYIVRTRVAVILNRT